MRLLLAVLFLGSATVVSAATELVKTADHGSFSRLVFYGQSEADWSLKRVEEGYLLQTPMQDFDLRDVFDRMEKRRVSDVIKTDAGLLIASDCDCHVNAFFLAPDMIVIDVNDGGGRNLGVDETVLTAEQKQGLRHALSKPAVRTQPLDLDQIDQSVDVADMVAAAEKHLLEQLGRAASQGLAEPKTGLEGTIPGTITPLAPRSSENESQSLSASTTIDQTAIGESDMTSDLANCVPAAWFPSKDWSVGGSFASGVGQLRSSLSDELGEITPDRTLALARHYVAHTFTIEAAQILDGTSSEDTEAVRLIIDRIDNKASVSTWPFSGKPCGGTVPFWHFILVEDAPASDAALADVLAALPNLPPDLARIAVPIAIQTAQKRGNADLAEDLATQFRYISDLPRSLMASGPEDDMALLTLARGSDPGSQRALLDYVQGQFLARDPVAADIPDLVAAYAFETKGSAVGAEFARAELMIAALTNQFAPVWSRLSERADDTDLIFGFYDLLHLNASDVQFIRLASPVREELDDALRRQIAERFLELGVLRTALDWIPLGDDRTTRLLKARVLLAMARPQEALEQIGNDQDPAAIALRALILSSLGDFTQAAKDFEASGLHEEAARNALLSADPAMIATHFDAELAQAMRTGTDLVDDAPPTLRSSRETIEAARLRLAALQRALQQFPEP